MDLQISPSKSFNYVTEFATRFGIDSTETELCIPPAMGVGGIRKIDIDADLVVLTHKYRLKEDFRLDRYAPDVLTDRITIIFYQSPIPVETYFSARFDEALTGPTHRQSTIEISANNLNSTVVFPANTDINFTVVGVSTEFLRTYLKLSEDDKLVGDIINGMQRTLIHHESMWIEIFQLLDDLSEVNFDDALGNLYGKLKVEELLYKLFYKLLHRGATAANHVLEDSVVRVETIRNRILKDLSTPPVLADLAVSSGLSQTKMKRVFKDTFGDSIYNYFQKARMDQAAFLLHDTSQPVSEIAERLGFLNLSHFARLFKKHYQVTPKKYSMVGSD